VAGGERDGDGGLDIVEIALTIVDEETRAWLSCQRELAGEAEGGPDAR
jgi:hypothetical protein